MRHDSSTDRHKIQHAAAIPTKDVPVSGRHGDTAQTGTARSGTVPTRPDTVRHGLAWRGLTWQIEVRGLANRSEGLGWPGPVDKSEGFEVQPFLAGRTWLVPSLLSVVGRRLCGACFGLAHRRFSFCDLV